MHSFKPDPKLGGPVQLTVTGVVNDSETTFGLGFAISRKLEAQPVVEHVKWLAADLLGADGEILTTAAIPAVPLCEIPAPETKTEVLAPTSFLVDSVISLVDGARGVTVRDEERKFLERTFATEPPTLERVSVEALGRGSYAVSWSAAHPEGGDMEHVVTLSDDLGRWRPVSLPSQEQKAVVEVAMPGDAKQVTFGVLSTDGLNSVHVPAEPVDVSQPEPAVVILSPSPGRSEEVVVCSAFAMGAPAGKGDHLRWSTSPELVLGQGSPLTVRLKPGKHLLTVELMDASDNVAATDTVEIVVS